MADEGDNVSSIARVRRLLALAPLLGATPLRAADAAELLSVTVRTIYRDMDALRAAGFPIEGDRGVGYTLADPPAVGPIALSRDERRALIAGAKAVKAGPDALLAKAASSLLRKVQGA